MDAIRVETSDYLPGRGADVVTSAAGEPVRAPVVVLVPGGGWDTADRSGLLPLARTLAAQGAFVVNATYRAGQDGARYPEPVRDVACAVSFAVAAARQRGVTPIGVIVAGHSAGGHLAALAALEPTRYAPGCPYDEARPTGLVGIAAAVDVRSLQGITAPFFGGTPDQRPDAWREGDPYAWTGADAESSRIPVLLLHGADDTLVPPASSERFTAALRAGGHDVALRIVPGSDHQSIYGADVAAPVLTAWLRTSAMAASD